MAKPLRTDDPAPQNMQFAHFGVLNDGSQSKGSLFTSVALNILLALVRHHHRRGCEEDDGQPHQAHPSR